MWCKESTAKRCVRRAPRWCTSGGGSWGRPRAHAHHVVGRTRPANPAAGLRAAASSQPGRYTVLPPLLAGHATTLGKHAAASSPCQQRQRCRGGTKVACMHPQEAPHVHHSTRVKVAAAVAMAQSFGDQHYAGVTQKPTKILDRRQRGTPWREFLHSTVRHNRFATCLMQFVVLRSQLLGTRHPDRPMMSSCSVAVLVGRGETQLYLECVIRLHAPRGKDGGIIKMSGTIGLNLCLFIALNDAFSRSLYPVTCSAMVEAVCWNVS